MTSPIAHGTKTFIPQAFLVSLYLMLQRDGLLPW